jgi:uncharacterized protein YjbI with pentapeptide repeats
MAKLNRTGLRDIKFRSCKMLGLHFENCNEFGLSVNFEYCNLSQSSFYKTKLKKQIFNNIKLQEVDFTECDLSGSVFDNCDLSGATFKNTILEKADLRVSISGISGLLDKYEIEIDFKG